MFPYVHSFFFFFFPFSTEMGHDKGNNHFTHTAKGRDSVVADSMASGTLVLLCTARKSPYRPFSLSLFSLFSSSRAEHMTF